MIRCRLLRAATSNKVAVGRLRDIIRDPGHARCGALSRTRTAATRVGPVAHADAGMALCRYVAAAAAGSGPRSRRGDPVARSHR